jgi:hypothetical protein
MSGLFSGTPRGRDDGIDEDGGDEEFDGGWDSQDESHIDGGPPSSLVEQDSTDGV